MKLSSHCLQIKPSAQSSNVILYRAGITGWALGKEKVFLKYYHADQLRQTLLEQHRYATIIQKMWRGVLARRRYAFREFIESRPKQTCLREFQLSEEMDLLSAKSALHISNRLFLYLQPLSLSLHLQQVEDVPLNSKDYNGC